MPVRLCLAFLIFLAAPFPAAAQDVSGSWVLRAEGAAIFRFDIEREGSGWRGVWTRPMAMNSDGNRFGNFSLQAVEVDSSIGNSFGDWAELTFPDPRPNGIPDVFRFRHVDDGHAEMIYGGTGWAPFTLESVEPGTPLGPFEIGKSYVLDTSKPVPRALPVLFSHPEAEFPLADPSPSEAAVSAPAAQEPERPAIIGR